MTSTQEKEERIAKLRKKIVSCRRCPLFRTRTHPVPGEGDVDARLMFIGEAPGRNEDLRGKPFVGRAGDIFGRLLTSVKLTRSQIYLCNILKCRPPENRNPFPEEIRACVGSLDAQLHIVAPEIICTLGNFAMSYIFEKFSLPSAKIGQVHGKVFDVMAGGGPRAVIPFYHPAVATYNSAQMPNLLKDFTVLKKFL